MSCNCEKNKTKGGSGRRSFLRKLIFSLSGLIAAFLAFPLVAAMLEPVVGNKKEVWRGIGRISDFKVGEMKMVKFKNASTYAWSEKIKDSAAYIHRNKDNEIIAFKINCSHLGCPVRWEEKAELFLCPCHGGAFYKDGSRAAGPPNRGLYTYPVRLKDKKIEIQTEPIPITNITV